MRALFRAYIIVKRLERDVDTQMVINCYLKSHIEFTIVSRPESAAKHLEDR